MVKLKTKEGNVVLIAEMALVVKSGNPYRQGGGKFGYGPGDAFSPKTSDEYIEPTRDAAGNIVYSSQYDKKTGKWVRVGNYPDSDKLTFEGTDRDTELDNLFADSKKHLADMSPEQLQALTEYTSEYGLGSYKEVNDLARTGEVRNVLTKGAKDKVLSAIDHPLHANVMLNRGLDVEGIADPKLKMAMKKASKGNFSQLDALSKGLASYDFSDSAPMSTSYMNSVNGFGQRPISLKIITDKTTKGLYMDPVSKYAGGSTTPSFLGIAQAEGEILLHPSNKFKFAGYSFTSTNRKGGTRANVYLVPKNHKYLSVKQAGNSRIYTYRNSDGKKYTIETESSGSNKVTEMHTSDGKTVIAEANPYHDELGRFATGSGLSAEEQKIAESAFGTKDKYVYHADSTNASVESFTTEGIRPSSDGIAGPGVYLANSIKATRYNYTSGDPVTMYKIDKVGIIREFGMYTSNSKTMRKYPKLYKESGLEFNEYDGEIFLAGNRKIPAKYVTLHSKFVAEMRTSDGKVVIMEANPYHDEIGRFTTGNGSGAGAGKAGAGDELESIGGYGELPLEVSREFHPEGDAAMRIIADKKGLNGKPIKVTKSEVSQLKEDGWQEMYRGYRGEKAQQFKKSFANDATSRIGYGAFGSGTYMTGDKVIAKFYADGKSSNVGHYLISSKAKGISYTAAKKRMLIGHDRVMKQFTSKAKGLKNSSVIRNNIKAIYSDTGRWAAHSGYDYIHFVGSNGGREVAVFNRGLIGVAP